MGWSRVIINLANNENFRKIISDSHLIYFTAGTIYNASQGKIIDTLISSLGIVSSLYHFSG